jgi:hypothetical protein
VRKTPKPEQIDKEKRVLELKRSGATWDAIAEVVGYSNASGAFKAYQRAMVRTLQQPAAELRDAEIDRLDRLQRAFWFEAIGDRDTPPNLRAADFILRVIDRRSKLLGLDAPTKVQAEVVTYDASSIESDIERIAYQLRGVDQGVTLALEAGASETGTTTA